MFQHCRWSITIDLNTTNIIFFRSPRGTQQISFIDGQLNDAQFLKESYELATKEPFGHLLIDLDPKTYATVQILFLQDPQFFYLPSAKAVITSLSDEREKSLNAGAAARDIGYKTNSEDRESSKSFRFKFLCECLLNIVNGNVPLRISFVEGYEKSFRKLLSRQTSLKKGATFC